MLGSIATGFYFLLSWKTHLVEVADTRDATIIIFFTIAFVILFNKFILSFIIHHLVDFEHSKTSTGYQYSFTLKYSIGLFFLSAFMTILVEGITFNNVYTHQYGIIEEETLMYFFVAFFVPLVWLINPWYISKWIQRERKKGSPFLTQEEAN